jgi:hypothetical protein
VPSRHVKAFSVPLQPGWQYWAGDSSKPKWTLPCQASLLAIWGPNSRQFGKEEKGSNTARFQSSRTHLLECPSPDSDSPWTDHLLPMIYHGFTVLPGADVTVAYLGQLQAASSVQFCYRSSSAVFCLLISIHSISIRL